MNSNAKRKRIWAVLISVLFVLTTAIGLLGMPVKSYAAGESTPSTLKFCQVAAGEDFAVALTYDGDLYGWSLIPNKTESQINREGTAGAETLGEYYPTVPKRIEVNFTYVSYETNGNVLSAGKSKPQGSYHMGGEEKITQIVATRKTAAFVTASGLVYTWGSNSTTEPTVENSSGEVLDNIDLLLHSTGADEIYPIITNHYEPAMINYFLNSSIVPVNDYTFASKVVDLVASEYNYILHYEDIKNLPQSFMWGQSAYNQLLQNNIADTFGNVFGTGTTPHRVSSVYTSESTSNETFRWAYLGDGNTYYITEAGLYVNGKNFAVNGADLGAAGSSISNTLIASTAVSTVNGTVYQTRSTDVTVSGAITNAFQGLELSGLTSLSPLTNSTATYKDSSGQSVTGLTVNRSVFSAGEGYGYLINGSSGAASGSVLFWGDASIGQGGTSINGTANAVQTLFSGTDYVQVVAGKRLTGAPIVEKYASSTKNAEENTDKWSAENVLKSGYVDSNEYLSAALTSTGAVNVFGRVGTQNINTNAASALGAYKVAANSDNQIVYLAGGYGNNLFAISSLGKIYRLTVNSGSLTAYMYDYFLDTDGEAIKNWAVNNTASVAFETGYYEEAENNKLPSQVTVSSKGLADENKVSDKNYPSHTDIKTNTNIIAQSYSGDAYRIILPKYDGKTISNDFDSYKYITANKYVKNGEIWEKQATAFNNKDADIQEFRLAGGNVADSTISNELQFYWSDDKSFSHPIDAEMAFRYFNIEFRYKEGSEVDFVITPLRSTGSQSIIIKYLVGRYDSFENFDTSVTSAAYFYDVQQVSVEVAIQNTDLTPVFETQKELVEAAYGVEQKMGSTVPLLDPNSPVNNIYSLAVMDVTEGLKAFRTKLNTILESTGLSFTEADVLSLVKGADKGFPAKSKIQEGNLLYYNKYADKYYTDVYEHLADDIDGDIIQLTNISNATGSIITNTSGDIKASSVSTDIYARYEKREVVLKFSLIDSKGNPVNTAVVTALQNMFEKTDDNVNVPRFNNLYGLRITVEEGGHEISVAYDVITVTAKSSMPEDFIDYADGDVSDPEYKLSSTNTSIFIPLIRPDLLDISTNKVKTLDNSAALHRGIEIFVQSSLSFNDINGNYYLGAPNPTAGANTYDYITDSDGSKVISLQLPVNTYNVKLANLFKDSSNIQIAYNGEVGEDIWDDIETTFGGGSNAVDLKVNDALDFTLTARRKISEFEFSIELRRVLPGTLTDTFKYNIDSNGGVEAETLRIYFKLSFNFEDTQWKLRDDRQLPDTINDETEFNLLDTRVDITTSVMRLCTTVAWSSNDDVISVGVSSDNSKLIFKPKTSGEAYIRYKVKLFGEDEYVLEDSFKVTVVVLFSMGKTVYVMDTVEVSTSELSGVLSNTLGTATFTLANVNDTNLPFYFEEGTLKAGKVDSSEDDNDYTWTAREEVPFLSSAFVDPASAKAYIGLVMGSYDPSASETVPVYRMVVQFAANGEHYLVAVRIAPSSQRLRYDNKEVEVTINKKENTISISSSGDNGLTEARSMGLVYAEDGSYEIPVSTFLKPLMGGNQSYNYVIIAAQAKSYDSLDDYSKYMEVKTVSEDAAQFFITPLYPTAELTGGRANVRVSVKNTNADSTSNNVTMLNFYVVVTGIETVLPVSTYKTIVLSAFFGVLALLIIVFFIRMGIYWKKKADQRRIIKKNQTLIKMREKMHNKTEAVSKEKLVRTKLKMEDPKYAKMFDEMRRNKEAETGIALENSLVASKVDKKMKLEKEKKKRGKKSLDELQEELAAKREAVARMQMGDFSEMPDGMATVQATPVQSVPPVEEVPVDGVPVFDPNAGFEGMSADDLDAQFKAAMADNSIVFEADENQSNENPSNENQ